MLQRTVTFFKKYWPNILCEHSSTQKQNYKNILKVKIALSFWFGLL